MWLEVRRLLKCSTACSQNSGDMFDRSRIGGAFFGIAPRFAGLELAAGPIQPLQVLRQRHEYAAVARCSAARTLLANFLSLRLQFHTAADKGYWLTRDIG